MKNRKILLLIFFSIYLCGCRDSGRKEQCSTKISRQVLEVMNDSVAYDYIKYSFDNNCKIDTALKDLFAIRIIGRDDKYFLLAYHNCCEQSVTNNEVGYCNGYLAEHYFVTNRFDLAASTYGDVLSLILKNGEELDSISFFRAFTNLTREDQNLYLTCLFSRANSYFRMQKYDFSNRDLDLGLRLSKTINPIFLESFERGFN